MPTAMEAEGPDLLGWWIRQAYRPAGMRARRRVCSHPVGLRFAFYGRISTEDFQDRMSSSRWQRDFAEDVVDGRGVIARIAAQLGLIGSTPHRVVEYLRANDLTVLCGRGGVVTLETDPLAASSRPTARVPRQRSAETPTKAIQQM